MPAPGPDLPVRPGLDSHALPQADVRQADPDLAADRPRPRALHPLLPLHTLLRERLGGRPARRDQPRGLVRDRHLRGRAVPRALQRQRRRALPRRSADVHDLSLPRTPLGDPERAHRLRPLPRRLQRLGDDTRREGRPRPLPQPPRGATRAGSATRAASPTTTCRRADRIRTPLLRVRRRGFEETSYEAALDAAEAGLREAGGSVVVAFSGGETVEQATALARLVRAGPRARRRPPPRSLGRGLGRVQGTALGNPRRRARPRARRRPRGRARAGRRPLAPRRPPRGRRVISVNPAGDVQATPGSAAQVCAALRKGGDVTPELRDTAKAVRGAKRIALDLVRGRPHGRPPRGGARKRPAREREAEVSVAYFLPRTPNGRGVAPAWDALGES